MSGSGQVSYVLLAMLDRLEVDDVGASPDGPGAARCRRTPELQQSELVLCQETGQACGSSPEIAVLCWPAYPKDLH